MTAAQVNQSRPALRPQDPNFSSGPCAKRPGWSLSALSARRTLPSTVSASPGGAAN